MKIKSDVAMGVAIIGRMFMSNSVEPDYVMTARLISDDIDCPYPSVEQIMLKLRKAGLLTVFRGPGGGYKLAKHDISVLDVFLAIGSTLNTKSHNTMFFSDAKAEQINKAFEDALRNISATVLLEKDENEVVREVVVQ